MSVSRKLTCINCCISVVAENQNDTNSETVNLQFRIVLGFNSRPASFARFGEFGSVLRADYAF